MEKAKQYLRTNCPNVHNFHMPSHFKLAFCIISCTATVVVRTAVGCFDGAEAAASAAPDSSGSCSPIELVAGLATASCQRRRSSLDCSSSCGEIESPFCVAPSFSCECPSTTCCGTLESKTFNYRRLEC